MEFCLVENLKEGWPIPSGCKVVAMTPKACGRLEELGINYLTFSDFFSTSEIRGDVDIYWKEQSEWFEEFDNFIRDNYPAAEEMNLSLATLYSVNIKNLVDTVILATRILNRFIDLAQPSKIWFVSEVFGEDRVERKKWFSYGKSIFCRLAEQICKIKGIEYSETSCNGYEEITNKPTRLEIIREFTGSVKTKAWNFFRSLREWYYENIYLSFCFSLRKHVKKNILILKGVDYLYEFCRDYFIRDEFKFFIKKGNSVYSSGLVKEKFLINHGKGKVENNNVIVDYGAILKRLMQSRITEWINAKCGIDISDILYSRFKLLVEDLFPNTMLRIKEFLNFYQEQKISYIINYSLSIEDDFAAVAAAKVSGCVQRIGIAHGVDALTSPHRYIGEYCHYDFYFMLMADEVDHARTLAREYKNPNLKINKYKHFRTNSIKKAEFGNKRALFLKKDRPIILFAPIIYSQRINMLIDKTHPLQWDYFKLHKALIEYFISKKECRFVWKSYWPTSELGRDPIAKKLNDRCASNIVYSSTDLNRWLLYADRLLFDCPSTAFYKGLFAGKPSLALFSNGDQEIRKGAITALGNTIKSYSYVDEAIDIIDKFIDDDPNEYLASIPQTDLCFSNVLQ